MPAEIIPAHPSVLPHDRAIARDSRNLPEPAGLSRTTNPFAPSLTPELRRVPHLAAEANAKIGLARYSWVGRTSTELAYASVLLHYRTVLKVTMIVRLKQLSRSGHDHFY